MISFGDRLKELRLEKQLNQTNFGKIFNVEKGTVSNWENENRFPDKNTLNSIADFFNVSMDYLLGRSNNRDVTGMPNKEKLSPEIKTIINNLESKDITPEKAKLINNLIDALFIE